MVATTNGGTVTDENKKMSKKSGGLWHVIGSIIGSFLVSVAALTLGRIAWSVSTWLLGVLNLTTL